MLRRGLADMDLIATAQTVVEALARAGIRADVDPDKLHPPCAWVVPDAAEITTLDGSGDVELSVFLVSKRTGFADEFLTLQELLTLALEEITPDGTVDLNAAVQTNNGSLPAFRIPLVLKAD